MADKPFTLYSIFAAVHIPPMITYIGVQISFTGAILTKSLQEINPGILNFPVSCLFLSFSFAEVEVKRKANFVNLTPGFPQNRRKTSYLTESNQNQWKNTNKPIV